ncbi:related to putative dual specificity protein kinase pom1 [Cephalotrichum gorgonifer]|uniref:dual-specificity kinase n=1 Tax=Cephalotrichum gorgonifer TaxID=2041049 RepID=A0AAE8MQ70_9PEZI|nr:related to putative dual specificity protein kinase pom1 [Cephalotrichum gorgonifer]
MLSTAAANSHPLFPSGRSRPGPSTDLGDTTSSFDFLPSVSFDDLQSSLETASTEFKLAQFPSPTGQGSILESKLSMSPSKIHDMSNVTQNGGTTRVVIPQPPTTRTARSGSLLRRPSTSSKAPTGLTLTTRPPSSGVSDAPTAPAATRPRRQSHYPPVSNSSIAKPPRKSIGPGTIETEYGARSTAHRRRPSLISNGDRTTVEPNSTRSSIDLGPSTAGASSSLTAATRASKARSFHSAPRPAYSSNNNTTTFEQTRTPSIAPLSPRAPSAKAPAGFPNKRLSTMPGVPSPSHISGLGARTISPTDTRRMKRMSMHHQTVNATQQPGSTDMRSPSRSPSMLPRKASATPSSSRTTPDVNRKSYSSGLSVGSNNSYNTVRTSTGSLQPRLPQSLSTSRLPAPKPLNTSHVHLGETDHDVPPVPAIPKAYESPKDGSMEAAQMEKRRLNFLHDAASISSNTTGSISMPPPPDFSGGGMRRKGSVRKSSLQPQHQQNGDADGKHSASTQARKNLQPLRLPPMVVGPLSTPTAAKIAALQRKQDQPPERYLSPPPSKMIPKTPTTPMTASKTTFFSRHRLEKADLPSLRSSSSIQPTRHDSPEGTDPSPSESHEADASAKAGANPTSISPYLSSSVPQGEGEYMYLKRSRTGNDFATITESQQEAKPLPKPNGAPSAKPTAKSPTQSSPEEPPTPSSMGNLRRKLSLSWKRNQSKGHIALPPGLVDKAPEYNMRQESMPPPLLPASAMSANMKSPSKPGSPTTSAKANGTYLDSRRRKSSTSSLNTFVSHDKSRTDPWAASTQHSTKLPSHEISTERLSLSRNSASMQKVLKPKSSTATLRQPTAWTAIDLDKDDAAAEEEMRKMGARRKETEIAARTLDALRKRATPKERVDPHEALRIAMLNIYERGEIVDYPSVYFCGTQNARKVVGDLQSQKPNYGYDDDRGDYTIVPGDHLSYRYEIIDVLGKGSFGQVVRCIDHSKGSLVAIKIIRNKKRFHQQALVEVNILKKLREWDPDNKHSMVNFTDHFYFRGHLCLSTELLDMNLYEFIKAHAFRGFSLKLIRRFSKQLLSSLTILKQHRVIHCDLKPENILLRHPLHSEIKVIDFGSSCFESEKVYTYIQSRFYRSPEVILGMTYGLPIDMWSLGCILAELFTGVPIFPGENEQEQLACIMEVFGPPEKHLIEKSTRKKLFFDSMGKPRLTVSSKGRRRRPSSKTLQQVLKTDDEAFLDFIARCLRWDPDRRMKPEEAIRHEFISGHKATLPRIPTRDFSPAKRGSHTLPGGARPLPEPPGGFRNGGTGTGTGPGRPRENSGASPHKSFSNVTRRASAVAGSTVAVPPKRTSTGGGGINMGTSSLPRAAGRSVSSKQDLASAGAAAAMSRRP